MNNRQAFVSPKLGAVIAVPGALLEDYNGSLWSPAD